MLGDQEIHALLAARHADPFSVLGLHTVEGGKLVRAHHVEDWAGALRQLKG